MRAVAENLKANGALHVDALFAHAPFEPSAGKNLSVFNDVWTSDSCPRLVPSEWVKVHVLDVLLNHLHATKPVKCV